MRKHILWIFVISTILLGCDKYDDSALKSDIDDLKSRVAALEQRCKNMNENLSSLQAIVDAIQKQDGIVSVVDLQDGQGYSVKFVSGKVIYLYNGKSGEDGVTPKISVRQDSDGLYYWIVNGEWLLVDGKKVRADGHDGLNGKDGQDAITPQFKIEDRFWYISYDNGKSWTELGKAVGDDGDNGQNGKDGQDAVTPQFKIEDGFWFISYDNGKSWAKLGKASGNDGQSGKDGQDAVTPQFKIEDGYWCISYDNGKSWTTLGKASGNDGKDGKDGIDGKNGDAFFKSVTLEDGYVIFVMNDPDQTTLKIPMAGTCSVSSIKYVPGSLDRVVKVKYFMDGDKFWVEDVIVKFEILPQGAVDYIVENWEEVLVAKAIYVSSTKAEIGDFVTLNIKGAVKDKDNIMIVTVDAGSLDDLFFSTDTPAGANLRLSVKLNGNEEVSSDYLPIVPYLSTDKVIEYTSASGKAMSSDCFLVGREGEGPMICTNSYNGDIGRITFECSPSDYYDPYFYCDFWRRKPSSSGYGYTMSENKELKSLRFATPIELSGLTLSQCSNLEKVDLSKVSTDNCYSMIYMFKGCSKIANLDLSALNTTNVKGMSDMFSGCSSLTSLDLSGFKTENVESMDGMFEGCSRFTSLDLSSFNTKNVDDMRLMFKDCGSLTSLDLSGFNTENVKNMSMMFQNCRNLSSLDLSSFNTKNVEDMNCMFQNCEKLTYLDMSGFHTGAVRDMHYMFYKCSSLTNLDLSGFDTQNVKSMSCMFIYCSNLTNLNLSSFRTDNVTNMAEMFGGCSSLVNLDLSGFNTGRAIHMAFMFLDCNSLSNLDLSGFNTMSCTSLAGMFWGCGSLKSLDLSNFNTEKVTFMNRMFQNCSSLVTLNLSGFNMDNVVDTSYMFDGCENLKKIIMHGCDKKTIEMICDVKPEGAEIITS